MIKISKNKTRTKRIENQNKNIRDKKDLNRNEIAAHTLSDKYILDGKMNFNEGDRELKQDRAGLKNT
jgi:hypothetical protein